ncbi:hypothetical protein NESM_000048000 [Novymonas esmeraldas]|uniref:Centrosomal protein POC5 n=1 Tax=Novymonas esmeraldas TaxID=1808958 RepID=A0AAW0F073_9TRYP
MPLVEAVTDDAFVAEVAEEVSTTCARMNDHVSAMIEEYLRRRVQQVRDSAKQELEVVRQQLEQRIATAEAGKAVEEEQHLRTKARVAQFADTMQRAHTRVHVERAFLTWQRCADLRRARRRMSEELLARTERLGVFRTYVQWRLLAAARRQRRLEVSESQRRGCREQELLGQIEVYQRQLEEERANNVSLSEKLKDAFVRGVCALNREAVQVLHGSEENQDEDVEAIAEILRSESHSRHRSVTPGHVDSSTLSHAHPHGVCPAHLVDSRGVFYHPCYAPGYCEYDRRPQPRPQASSDAAAAAATPFVVRGDLQSTRTVDSGPLVPLRHLARPSQTRWKI